SLQIKGGSLGTSASGVYVPLNTVGVPNGVPSLDSTGKVPSTQLPPITGTVTYQGAWNPVTNTPVASNGARMGGVVQPRGNYYVRSVSGTSPPVDGLTTWNAGEWLTSNGTTWERVQTQTNPYLPLSGGVLSGNITAPNYLLPNNDSWTVSPGNEPDCAWSIRS